ncbi:MAG TPA: DeoR/GlpR family DNA-binding transcription regulator [Actinocrinis sp.]|jgi:DeoR/GlpR family transcriptional regulator of sugar metabolism
MLAAQRQAWILEEIRRSGAIRVSDLTRALSVSDMTVRRDLDALARKGLIDKVHGGATVRQPGSTDEPGFEAKVGRERRAKDAIAHRAAALVRPGTAIGVTAGTTTHAFALAMAGIPDVTVVTNSLRVGEMLHAHGVPSQTVILTGGMRTPSDALVGPVAIQSIRALHLDCVFMGVHGMDDTAGFTSPNLMEAETNRALIDAARRVVVLADHTKWGVVGLCAIADLTEAAVLVTDPHLEDEARELLSERVGELVLADPDADEEGVVRGLGTGIGDRVGIGSSTSAATGIG